jgi:tetratricopeptide (TPR) repeat protein
LKDTHGKIKWFEGTYQELLAKAAEEDKVIFLNFYTDWCTWCKQLDKEAFSDPKVLLALENVLSFCVDAESDAGVPLVNAFPTRQTYPALIFLNPDGSLRDRVGGYKNAEVVLSEFKRIIANHETLQDFENRVKSNPKNLSARWDLARKMSKLENKKGYEEQLKIIRELDPLGKSLTSRRISMRPILRSPDNNLNPQPMRDFLAKETYPEILFRGWHNITWIERRLATHAIQKGNRELAATHMKAFHKAFRLAWEYCPRDRQAEVGNDIAYQLYLDWGSIDAEQREFAVEVSRDTVEVSPFIANYIDTYACCLFASGETEEAVKQIKKCIQLEPDRGFWQERLEMFLAEEI